MYRTPRENKRLSVNQENEIAERMRDIYGDAHVQPGSGNQPGKPNDVRIPGYAYIEAKFTSSHQIVVKREWLDRLRMLANPLRGYLAIMFYPGANYYVVEDVHFEHLLKCELELRDLRQQIDEGYRKVEAAHEEACREMAAQKVTLGRVRARQTDRVVTN